MREYFYQEYAFVSHFKEPEQIRDDTDAHPKQQQSYHCYPKCYG